MTKKPRNPVDRRDTGGNTVLTTTEVARHYRVSVANVLWWIRTGALGAINTSKGLKRNRYRIRREDLAEFEKARTTKPLPKAPKQKPRKRGRGCSVIEFW